MFKVGDIVKGKNGSTIGLATNWKPGIVRKTSFDRISVDFTHIGLKSEQVYAMDCDPFYMELVKSVEEFEGEIEFRI